MTVYFVDDGGTPTDPYDTWAKAAASIQALDSAKVLASGDIIYIGADSNCTDAGAALSITGPASGLPVTVISSTVGAGSTVAYSVGTGDQILATGATSDVTFNGAFSMHGIRVRVGRSIILDSDGNENFYSKDCIFALGAGGTLQGVVTNISGSRHFNLTLDLTADGTTPTATAVITPSVGAHGNMEMTGTVFINPAYRTGSIISAGVGIGKFTFSGSDLSGFGTGCEIVNMSSSYQHFISNCIAVGSYVPYVASPVLTQMGCLMMTNVGPADSPSSMTHMDFFGSTQSSSAIYRQGGASVEGEGCGWLVTTNIGSSCNEYSPYFTPWIYGTTTNGTRTFTLYGTCNNSSPTTAALQNDEIWLEVEMLSTADEALWVTTRDRRTLITDAAADQTAETSSTWVGLNDAGQGFADFRFKLECASVSVGESGQYRARVAVAKAAITSSSYLYLDPKIEVS